MTFFAVGKAILGMAAGIAVALLLMLGGQRIGIELFPVTASPLVADGDELNMTLFVPVSALAAHLVAAAIGALSGAFVAGTATRRVALSAWIIGGLLALVQLFAVAEVPKDTAFAFLSAVTALSGRSVLGPPAETNTASSRWLRELVCP